MLNGLKGAITGAIGAGLVIALVAVCVVDFSLPDAWSPDAIARNLADDLVDVEEALEVKEPATIVTVEPIALDCRARVQATVPVEGIREVEVAGVVIRTDTVTVDAEGDVDTCVDADQVEIRQFADGGWLVDIPGEAIQFVRPRVDMVASAENVEYDKGFVGELTDLLPGVADGDSMIPAAYAFAQQVIGGDACMREAFDVTSQALEQAYVDQVVAQGLDPEQVEVTIGDPDFDQNRLPDETGDIDFVVRNQSVRCMLAPGAHDGAQPSWDESAP